MKAIVYTKYGSPDVLQLKEIEKPAPKENEVLIRIYATTVNRTDCATIRAIPFFARILTGLFKPKKQIPGTEFAGRIEEIGKNVKSLKVGDRVFGFDHQGSGPHAQYMTTPENEAVTIPKKITYEQAAASTEGAHYAYNSIKKINIKSGQKVLVNGATGNIGTFAVQVAKSFGAEVTGVDSTRKLDMLRSIGADQVIDYTQEDFTKSGENYDIIFDAVGKSSFSRSLRSLKQNGRYLLAANPRLLQMVRALWTSMISSLPVRQTGKKVIFEFAR